MFLFWIFLFSYVSRAINGTNPLATHVFHDLNLEKLKCQKLAQLRVGFGFDVHKRGWTSILS